MGKKESQGNQSMVDRYRKNIGKQDYKKSKHEVKESVNKAQMKRSAKQIYQELSLMVGAMLFVFFFLYAVFYLILTKEGKKNDI